MYRLGRGSSSISKSSYKNNRVATTVICHLVWINRCLLSLWLQKQRNCGCSRSPQTCSSRGFKLGLCEYMAETSIQYKLCALKVSVSSSDFIYIPDNIHTSPTKKSNTDENVIIYSTSWTKWYFIQMMV